MKSFKLFSAFVLSCSLFSGLAIASSPQKTAHALQNHTQKLIASSRAAASQTIKAKMKLKNLKDDLTLFADSALEINGLIEKEKQTLNLAISHMERMERDLHVSDRRATELLSSIGQPTEETQALVISLRKMQADLKQQEVYLHERRNQAKQTLREFSIHPQPKLEVTLQPPSRPNQQTNAPPAGPQKPQTASIKSQTLKPLKTMEAHSPLQRGKLSPQTTRMDLATKPLPATQVAQPQTPEAPTARPQQAQAKKALAPAPLPQYHSSPLAVVSLDKPMAAQKWYALSSVNRGLHTNPDGHFDIVEYSSNAAAPRAQEMQAILVGLGIREDQLHVKSFSDSAEKNQILIYLAQ